MTTYIVQVALDPTATARIEDLMQELRKNYTVIIVTHNLQQATVAEMADRASPDETSIRGPFFPVNFCGTCSPARPEAGF